MPLRNVGRWSRYVRRTVNPIIKKRQMRAFNKAKEVQALSLLKEVEAGGTGRESAKQLEKRKRQLDELSRKWDRRAVNRPDSRVLMKIVVSTAARDCQLKKRFSAKKFSHVVYLMNRWATIMWEMIRIGTELDKKFGNSRNWPSSRLWGYANLGDQMERYEREIDGIVGNKNPISEMSDLLGIVQEIEWK